MKITKNLKFLYKCHKNNIRYRILQGGTRSGKTYSTLQFLVWYAYHNKNKRIYILGKTIPYIKDNLMNDFEEILVNLGVSI